MTERGLPGMDGAPACPFVAFGDDREARSTSPDHRHRCFAETPPAPRAVAHQEAYCLSSAFPVCPTFQDWARREAAQARAAGERSQAAPAAPPQPATAAEPDLHSGRAIPPGDEADTADADEDATPDDDSIQRNPPRDWAAPPPWATGPIGSGGAGRPPEPGAGPTGADVPPGPLPPPRPVEGQGLAGSPADRLAGGEIAAAAVWSASGDGSASTAPDDELAGLVQGRPSATPSAGSSSGTPPQVAESVSSAPPARSSADAYPPSTRTGKRPAVSSTRDVVAGPSWERLQTHEAYPTIKSGSSMRGVPRVAVLAGALGIAALAVFMLPALLGIGGGGGNSTSASPSGSRPASTASHAPTVKPAATPVVYVLKKGDTLSKVANKFDVTLEELLAANPDIKNPNKVSLGQEIIIPTAAGGSTAPAATAAPS